MARLTFLRMLKTRVFSTTQVNCTFKSIESTIYMSSAGLVIRDEEYRGIKKHSSRRPSEASSLGLLRRAIAPVVRWRQRTVCMCALTDTSLRTSGGVHESATGSPHLSDGLRCSHDLEYTGALAPSLFITWKSPMRVGLSCYPARTQAVVGFQSGDTWRSRDFQLC